MKGIIIFLILSASLTGPPCYSADGYFKSMSAGERARLITDKEWNALMGIGYYRGYIARWTRCAMNYPELETSINEVMADFAQKYLSAYIKNHRLALRITNSTFDSKDVLNDRLERIHILEVTQLGLNGVSEITHESCVEYANMSGDFYELFHSQMEEYFTDNTLQ